MQPAPGRRGKGGVGGAVVTKRCDPRGTTPTRAEAGSRRRPPTSQATRPLSRSPPVPPPGSRPCSATPRPKLRRRKRSARGLRTSQGPKRSESVSCCCSKPASMLPAPPGRCAPVSTGARGQETGQAGLIWGCGDPLVITAVHTRLSTLPPLHLRPGLVKHKQGNSNSVFDHHI